MNKVFTAVITTLFLASCAGMAPIPEESKSFETVIDVPGKTKEQLYVATKTWFGETFNSAKEVIQVDSREDGLIIGTGIIGYPCATVAACYGKAEKVSFTMKTEIKDSKYKVSFSNIRLITNAQPGLHKGMNYAINTQGDLDNVKPALLQLASSINESNSKKASKDW